MKILQIVQKPQRRGAEVFAFQLSQALRSQGHEVRAVYLYPYLQEGALPLQGEDQVLAGRENHLLEKFPGTHPQLLFHLVQAIKEFEPDVIQVNGGRTVKYGVFAHQICCNGQRVLIYRNIGQPRDWVRSWYHRFFYSRLVMPQLDGVVGVSQTTLQAVKEFYGLSTPTRYIPRAVDPQALRPTLDTDQIRSQARTPLEARVVIYVGSLTSEKRLDRLLRVAAQVRTQIPYLYLWLVGGGPLRGALEEQARQLGLDEVTRFLGVQEHVANYLNAADLFALTSDTEGIPGVILEAGVLGLPAVATQVGGVSECVVAGKTGLLVEPANEAGLAEAMTALLQDPSRRRLMGEQARERVNTLFRMDKITQQYLDFYQQVLGA